VVWWRAVLCRPYPDILSQSNIFYQLKRTQVNASKQPKKKPTPNPAKINIEGGGGVTHPNTNNKPSDKRNLNTPPPATDSRTIPRQFREKPRPEHPTQRGEGGGHASEPEKASTTRKEP